MNVNPKPTCNLIVLLIVVLLASCTNEPGKTKKDIADKEVVSDLPHAEQTACLLSEIAYCDNQQTAVENYMPGWKVVWEADELGGNHCFVATNDTIYGMGIRGSVINFSFAAFQNWFFQDLNIASVQSWKFTNDSSKAKIAQGAYIGWQNLVNMKDKHSGKTLVDFFDNDSKQIPVLISGHSLGGNLATVFGSWLYQHFKETGKLPGRINVISFGAPAAGNAAFANDFNKKFPNSVRYENSNDIVPKFPCRSGIGTLNALFKAGPDASKIMVGYRSTNVSLSNMFSIIGTGLIVLDFQNGEYVQTNGKGKLIDAALSGKFSGDDIGAWFNEAAYHHSMSVYANFLKAPVVKCN